jgi:hypothetical protein
MSQPPAPPANAPDQSSVVITGDASGTSTNPNPVTSDCLIAFGNKPLGCASINSPFDVGVNGSIAGFRACDILVLLFSGDATVTTTVGEVDLANAVQALFDGTQNRQCQVTFEANGLGGICAFFQSCQGVRTLNYEFEG